MEVDKLMTRGVRTSSAADTLNRAAQIMWDNDCGCVPVVDAGGKVTGMITDRDICMAAYMQGKRLAEITISEVVSRIPVTVREKDDVEAAERLMQEHQIRRIPVVDATGRLTGVLSMSDIARCAEMTSLDGEGIGPREVAKTLAAVSQPHRQGEASGRQAA